MARKICRAKSFLRQTRRPCSARARALPHAIRTVGTCRHILKIIAAAPISESAKRTASAIFTALGEAEAKVHNVPVEKVHFHEVGAADAIVDIVCAAVGAEALQVERIVASPLNVGGGTVKCNHGVMPVPAPATLELLKGIPVYSGEVAERAGDADWSCDCQSPGSSFGPRPSMTTETIGYGAGARNFADHSNVLRLVVGETVESYRSIGEPQGRASIEEIAVLEANLDDLSPQVIGYTARAPAVRRRARRVHHRRADEEGPPGNIAHAFWLSLQDEARLRGILFEETSTLGVRSRRETAPRPEPSPRNGADAVGRGANQDWKLQGDTELNAAPEYEDCRRIAAEQKLSR